MPKLNTFLNPIYLKKTRIINELSADLFSFLPSAFIQHCAIANIDFEQGKLLIACESSIWASKLRYYHPDISGYLQSQHKIKNWQIKTRVMPSLFKTNTEQTSKPQLSSSAAQNLQSLAQNTTHDNLQAALTRLAQRYLKTR